MPHGMLTWLACSTIALMMYSIALMMYSIALMYGHRVLVRVIGPGLDLHCCMFLQVQRNCACPASMT